MKTTSILPTAVAVALTAALLPAQAALVQFNFSTTVSTGPLLGEVGTGFIRFDDAFAGADTVSPGLANGSLEIGFSFLGQNFNETHDQDFPNFPLVTLFEGLPVGIDFVMTEGFSGVDFTNGAITTIALQGALLPAAGGQLLAPIDIQFSPQQELPEPSTYALAGLALLGLALGRRSTRR